MTKETLLMQYQSECLSALKSVANIHKPFEKAFMDTMKLFMAQFAGEDNEVMKNSEKIV